MSVQTPREYLGFDIGEDRRLAGWPQVVGYCTHLADRSPRVLTSEIGKSTEGNPFILSVISSERNLARLADFRRIQSRLADPRTLVDPAESERLIAAGKTVVLVTCSIHATEVGGTQTSLALMHHLATSESPDVAEILENVIVLLVPSMNPDGLIKVKAWYDRTLGTRHEGAGPPFLYHKYAGHDNNRDWFMFNLAETRLVVEHCLNAWHPHITYDVHQTRPNGMRMILPPFQDPVEPNVNPILEGELAMLGAAIASELTARGKSGVAMNVVYDAFSPSRSYPHYHGGVRVLTEVAGAHIASPIELQPEDLRSARGEHPTRRSWNHPLPWPGGRWGLPEIVDYNLTATLACLRHAARYRDMWLRNFHRVRCQAVATQSNPVAFVLPARQRDPSAADEMLDILRTAMVEVHEARKPFLADGLRWEAGDRVVLLNQPNGPFARATLEPHRYPDMRLYQGGPPRPPYDVTAHTLPLLMGVKAVQVKKPFEADLKPWGAISSSPLEEEDPRAPASSGPEEVGGGKHVRYLLGAEENASARVVNTLLDTGAKVERLLKAAEVDGRTWPVGTYAVTTANGPAPLPPRAVPLHHVHITPTSPPLRAPRVGLYQSFMPNPEVGWTRLVLEQYGFHYELLTNDAVKKGKLAEQFDAVILPHQAPRQMERGHGPGSYPHEYAGGLGVQGAQALYEFVKQGGTLAAWDGSAEYVNEHLELGVVNALADVPRADFYAPGSLLEVRLDTAHPLAFGMPETCAVMFLDSPAFEPAGVEAVATYGDGDPLLSGWLIGPERLRGKAALVVRDVGQGHAVLFGFRPIFRAQARGTYRLVFNALYWSVARG